MGPSGRERHDGQDAEDAGNARGAGQARVASLGYVPGFDGLRALGLLVMLAYHHGIGAARGGIFTVSMFFTLSGFLIASLALTEWSLKGRLSLGRFWERRARRLLPAALATAAGVVALQHFFDVGSGDRFRGDVLAALGYVANWRFAASDGDYAAIFAIESPVQHFWSLAVEEQFYLAFPLLFVGLLKVTKGRRQPCGAAFGLATLASFVAAGFTAARYGNSSLAYYATYTRAGEVLLGVTAAFAVTAEPVRRALSSPRGVRAAHIGGGVGLAGLAWLWHTISLDNPFVFRGGTALNAVCTLLVILACTGAPTGVVARLLALWPLRNLGKISYGVYLFHWPLFLLLDEERTGLGYQPLFVVRVAASIGLAVVSYHLLETPFRFRVAARSRPRLAGIMAAPAMATAGLVLVVPVHQSPIIDLGDAPGVSDWGDDDPYEPGVVVPSPGREPDARVLLVGDSVSWTMWPGLASWNEDPRHSQIHVDAMLSMGCTLAEAGTTEFLGNTSQPWPKCRNLRDRLAEVLAWVDYDVVLVELGHKDVGQRQVAGALRHLGDPEFDAWFHEQVAGFADILAGTGSDGPTVLWATTSRMRAVPGNDFGQWANFGENDPTRVDRLNEIVTTEVEDRSGFHVVDIATWLTLAPQGEFDRDYRADGIHWTFAGSDALAAWVVPQILEHAPAPTTVAQEAGS